jgi:hypothetical protein
MPKKFPRAIKDEQRGNAGCAQRRADRAGETALGIDDFPRRHRDESRMAFVVTVKPAGALARRGGGQQEREDRAVNHRLIVPMLASFAVLAPGASGVLAQQATMTFFVTSAGPGKGADLGGLAGADRHCQQLAQAVGAGSKTWRAYLSTQVANGAQAVNARDRIGAGPWQNAKGEVIARNVDDLHSPNNKIGKQTALSEKGETVNGRGDSPNRHDILTGSQPDGRAFPAGEDKTCGNWTKSGEGTAIVGHHDRQGLRDDDPSKSWNSSHPSRGPDGGCSQADLRSTGGDGLFYCFAIN